MKRKKVFPYACMPKDFKFYEIYFKVQTLTPTLAVIKNIDSLLIFQKPYILWSSGLWVAALSLDEVRTFVSTIMPFTWHWLFCHGLCPLHWHASLLVVMLPPSLSIIMAYISKVEPIVMHLLIRWQLHWAPFCDWHRILTSCSIRRYVEAACFILFTQAYMKVWVLSAYLNVDIYFTGKLEYKF